MRKNICGGPLYKPVDTTDDDMMVRAGIRPPKLEIDRETFIKTSEEKALLKRLKRDR